MRGAWADFARHPASRFGAAGVVLLLVVLVVWREPISRRLFPDPRLNQQLERAAAALARRDLSRADGQGARELYEAALAIDPDQIAAREGLARVRSAAVAQAEAALRGHRLAAARAHLALARDLSAPVEQLQPLQSRLQDLEDDSARIPGLLAQAAAPGVEPTTALGLYERVLAIEADNALALEGRRVLLAQRLAQATQLATAGDVLAAQALVDEVVAHDPGHLDLPDAQAALGEARTRWQRQQARDLAEAKELERRGRLERAATLYRHLQAQAPESEEARAGLRRCADALALRAMRLAADFRFRQAQESLAQARAADPAAPAIAAAQQRLAQARLARSRLERNGAPGAADDVPALLAQARAAMQRGDFIEPPGTSAWDRLRVAAAIAPREAGVRRLQAEFRRQARACFEQALLASDLRRAQACLDARLAQDPAAAATRAACRQLAERWQAYAEERIAASDYAAARRAVAAWRALAPTDRRIPALEARLRRAEGSVR